MTDKKQEIARPAAWANWKVGTKSYVPFRTQEEASRSVEQSEIAATQLGPYEVVALYAAHHVIALQTQLQQEKMVTITEAEYEQLSEDSRFLCALRNAGVDNWSGYEEAQEMIEEWDAEG